MAAASAERLDCVCMDPCGEELDYVYVCVVFVQFNED